MSAEAFNLIIDNLRFNLRDLRSLIIAFSAGVDSSLLLYVAAETLGCDKVLAVTASSETYVASELSAAKEFTSHYKIPHRIITTAELDTINSNGNNERRCYHCKKELFTALLKIAKSEGFNHVAEGSNADDTADYRPGRQAITELGIKSPLLEAGLTKADIRELSKSFGLPTWDKPAYACLTSRFPYFTKIEPEALQRIESAENYLHAIGFKLCRVRHYDQKARLEFDPADIARAISLRAEITQQLILIGYTDVEIDPLGYRTGSMNEQLIIG